MTSRVRTLVESLAPVVREYVLAELQQRDAVLATLRAQQDSLLVRLAMLEARALIPGPQGERGLAGERGTTGPMGPMGPPGERGLPGERGERGLDGKDGAPGRDGQDGAKGLDGKDGRHGVDGQPGRDGRDGLPGLQGATGLDGLAGKDGRDGLDGQKGLDGKDGVDGLGFDDLDIVFDEERGYRVRFVRGEIVKEFPISVPWDAGVWRAGRSYPRGASVTQSGALWIAQADTFAKPGEPTTESRAWRLAVKAGRDAKPRPE